jgi:hypothetical protein
LIASSIERVGGGQNHQGGQGGQRLWNLDGWRVGGGGGGRQLQRRWRRSRGGTFRWRGGERQSRQREREKKRRRKTREQFNRQLAVGMGPVDVSPRPSNDDARSERRDQSSCVQDMTGVEASQVMSLKFELSHEIVALRFSIRFPCCSPAPGAAGGRARQPPRGIPAGREGEGGSGGTPHPKELRRREV